MKLTSYPTGHGDEFTFSAENLERAKSFIARYPQGRQASAVIALLDLAQIQNGGWLSGAAIEHVAEVLEMAPIRVYEVASFYTMFNLKPVGRHHIQVCRTTPCWLRGAADITQACRDKLGIDLGDTSEDGLFTLSEVECLGACANAPMVQIDNDYYEDLSPERMAEIIDELRAGKDVTPGPQSGRQGSAPEGGPTTLTQVPARAASDTAGGT